MKKIALAAIAALIATANALAASPAATQDWVRNYLATNSVIVGATTTMTETNGVRTASCGTGDDEVVVRVEEFTDAALLVLNSTGEVTNGTVFVWNGQGRYVNRFAEIFSTRTNLVFSGTPSVATNGLYRFEGWFDVKPIVIQPSTSMSITNAVSSSSIGIGDALCSVIDALVPSAYAAIPQSAEGWWTPDSGWDKEILGNSITMDIYDSRSMTWNSTQIDVTVTPDGRNSVTRESVEKAFLNVKASVMTALYAVGAALGGIVGLEYEVSYNRAAIQQIGKNLDDLMNKNGIEITDKSGKSYTIRFNGSLKGSASGGMIDATTDKTDDPIYTDDVSVSIRKEGSADTLEITGWKSAKSEAKTIADRLGGGEELAGWNVLARKSGTDSVRYLNIGKLDGLKVTIDGESIETNRNGMGIFGFYDAKTGTKTKIPKTGNNKIEWVEPVDLLDGEVFSKVQDDDDKVTIKGIADAEDGSVIVKSGDGIKWASTDSSGYYYGTPQDGTGIGFWELPNVTTNSVQGDEETITAVSEDGGIKRLGLIKPSVASVFGPDGWTPAQEYGGTVADDVTLEYVDKEGEEASTNRVLQIKGWSGEEEIADGFLSKKSGALVSVSVSGINGVETNATESSVTIGLQSWDAPTECECDMSDLMTNADKSQERLDHMVLARHNDGEGKTSLHYIPFGDAISPVAGTNAVDVITGIQFQIGTGADGEKKVQYKLTRTSIVAWVGSTTTDADWSDVFTAEKVEAVTKSEYDADTHQFNNYVTPLHVISSGEEKVVSPAVFEAAAMSEVTE